jgi:Tfp pilus assembly protein PilX
VGDSFQESGMKQVFRARRATPAQQGLTLIGQMMVLLLVGALGAVALSSKSKKSRSMLLPLNPTR